MKVQTVLYGPCKQLGHTDCTSIYRWHTGTPTRAETLKYDCERTEPRYIGEALTTTYRLTMKGTTC